MTKLNEMSKAYQPMTTKNICELEKVPVDIDVKENTYQKDDGTDFQVLEAEIEGQKYRIPKSVLPQLKAFLEKKPDMTHFTVSKSGSGMNTQYHVMNV